MITGSFNHVIDRYLEVASPPSGGVQTKQDILSGVS